MNYNSSRSDGGTSRDPTYLFKYLLLANMCMYLEAGAIPAMLIQIAESFDMLSGQQGLLGGIAYLSLGFGSPFAGYLMRTYNHKSVLVYTVGINNVFTLLWALTPVGKWYSTALFIFLRFVMGLMQCIVCVFMPLWTNEFAPAAERTKWMGALQASVPFGVMGGYIIAAIMIGPSSGTDTCMGLLCWRWPLIAEWAMLAPFCVAVYFVPASHLHIRSKKQSTRGFKRLRLRSLSLGGAEDHSSSVGVAGIGGGKRTYGTMQPGIMTCMRSRSMSADSKDEHTGLMMDNEQNVAANSCDPESDDVGAAIEPKHSLGYITSDTPDQSNASNCYPYDMKHRLDMEGQSCPELAHIRRKSWSSVQKRSMCASLFTAMSTREALRMSLTEEEGDGLMVHDSVDDLQQLVQDSGHLDNSESGSEDGGEMASKGSDIEYKNRADDEECNKKQKDFPFRESGVQYESLSKVQQDYIDKANSLIINKTPPRRDMRRWSSDFNILRVRSAETDRRSLLRFNSDLAIQQDDRESFATPFKRYSRLYQRDSDTESDSDAYAHLFFSPHSTARSPTQVTLNSDSDSFWRRWCCRSGSPARSVLALLQIPVYRSLLLALTALYFVVTGVQFWGTSYMLVALSAPRALVNSMFVFCAGTGPTLGVFFGGWIVDRMGGYVGSAQRVVVLKLCVCMGLTGCICATLAVFATTFSTFIVCLWLLLFSGASLLPACTGILVSVVPRKYRPISSSLSIMTFNIFGYSLSLFLSGYLMQAMGFYWPECDYVCTRKFGFRVVLLWSYWSMLFLSCGLWGAIRLEKKIRASNRLRFS